MMKKYYFLCRVKLGLILHIAIKLLVLENFKENIYRR